MLRIYFLISLSAFPLVSMGQVTEGLWTYIVEDGGVTITASTATGAVTIPSELGGSAVKKVGDGSAPIFGWSNTSVTSITISSSITTPTSTTISSSVTSSVTSIGSSAFSGCTSLTSIAIPRGVTSIGSSAFSGCTSLTSIILPNDITIPRSSLTSIGDYAFNGCTSLTSITLPNSVTSFGEGTFNNCPSLTSIIIGSGGLSFNPGGSIILSGGLLFNPGGSIILNPIIPQETEGEWTYIVENGAATITATTATGAVTIPSELGGYAVKKVGNNVLPISGKFGNLNNLGIGGGATGSIRFTGDDLNSYKNTSVTSVVIPNSVTSVGNNAFYNFSSLTSITIGTSVTSIGSGAFTGCTSLTSIILVDGLPAIGSGWFAGIPVTSITIPNSVTSIGESAFSYCTGLTSITIPSSVTSIGSGAFTGCTGLTSMNIPNSVTSIGSGAFTGCTGLTSMNIPNSVTSIGSGAFTGCSGLTSVTMPDRFIGQVAQIGLSGQVASDYIINALANNDDFVTAVANKIKATSGNYGLATQSGVTGSISSVINEGRAAGIARLMASPNTWSLFTTSQIQNMAIGDLVLTRELNGNFVLKYDIEQSDDLANWTVYSANTQIVKLPADKAFVRIKAKQ